MKHLRIFDPHPALQSILKCVMVIHESHEAGKALNPCHYPPTPQHTIFLYLHEKIKAKKSSETEFTEQPRCVVVGPQVTRVSLLIGPVHKAVAIGFEPGGLHRFLGVPMHEIFDAGFDGSALLGNSVNELIEKCMEAGSHEEINSHVQNYMLGRLSLTKAISPFDKAMMAMLNGNGLISVTELADNACLSLRQFERQCYQRVGLSPKLYARIIRFSNAYRLFEKDRTLTWTNIAHHCGYYDQMHFIRDFKEFSGVTPTLMDQELADAPFRFQADIRI
jgi:AraC-like DNA-binding protein